LAGRRLRIFRKACGKSLKINFHPSSRGTRFSAMEECSGTESAKTRNDMGVSPHQTLVDKSTETGKHYFEVETLGTHKNFGDGAIPCRPLIRFILQTVPSLCIIFDHSRSSYLQLTHPENLIDFTLDFIQELCLVMISQI